MVKINHKSKRQPAKRRYKIEKRIRDHNKKTRRETKKTENKKNKKKNITVPNKFPLKEEILVMSEKQKQDALEEKRRQKLERKKQKKEAASGGEVAKKKDEMAKTIDELLSEAARKQSHFERMQLAMGKSPFEEWTKNGREKETSLKTFYKEFKKVVDAADVIIQVLDARDPIGSRCPQAEEMIHTSGANKKLILLINKIDLVPKENVQKWLKYFRNQYPTVAFKASTQNQNEKLSQSSVPVNMVSDNLLRSSKCLGANILLKLLNNYTRTSNDIKQSITVGIIGLPNVGKSSVINSLKRSHACMIGSVPGLTRCMQEVKLDKHIKLLDSPGIVMSKDEDSASLALKNCIKIENLEDPLAPIELLIQRCNKEQLVSRYVISMFADATEFLNLVAKRYGKMKKNGIPDLKKAAQMVLNDWNNGKLTYYTLPPENTTGKVLETKLVTEASPEFDIDALLKDDEEELFEAMDDDTKLIVKGVEVSTGAPIKTSFEMLDKDDGNEDNDDGEDEKQVKFKTDVSLNKKVEKKMAKARGDENENGGKSKSVKRKAAGGESEDEDEEDDEEEIYRTEDIPRTKKMQKLEMKKRQKKLRKNDKIFSNLGDMLNNVNLVGAKSSAVAAAKKGASSSSSRDLYDFKKDFKN